MRFSLLPGVLWLTDVDCGARLAAVGNVCRTQGLARLTAGAERNEGNNSIHVAGARMTAEAPATTRIIVLFGTDWKMRAAETFCWAVWATLLLIAVRILVTQTSNIPMYEDWYMVPSFAGLENNFVAWLWEQHNEHRVPVPKLILLAILKLTGGNFKACMAANLAFLAAISAALMVAVKSGRGGRARFSDALFPVVFLNAGHWENMFWAWEMTFVLSVVLGCIPLVVLAARRPLNTVRALWLGFSLVAAPLCGATGILYVPLLTMWSAYTGLKLLRAGGPKRVVWILLVCSILTVAVCGVYFVNYIRPEWIGPRPTGAAALRAASQVLALAFGPVARSLWTLLVAVTLILLLVAGQCLLTALRRAYEPERSRILGLVAFFLTTLFYAAATGYGRADVVAGTYGGFPVRYCLLAVPVLCVAYIAIDQFGTSSLTRHLPSMICIAVLVLLPFNMAQGYAWAEYFKPEVRGIREDIQRGMPSQEIAERHNGYLMDWISPQDLAELLRMAHDSKIYPFSSMRLDPSPDLPNGFVPRPQGAVKKTEIRCHIPGATRVVLVWGVDGWKWLPKSWLPPDTFVIHATMHTTMQRDGEWFQTTLAVPEGHTVDYGFNINRSGEGGSRPVWRAGAEAALLPTLPQIVEVPITLAGDTVETPVARSRGTPAPYQIRYDALGASEVRLVWGVDGWTPLALPLRPQDTEVEKGVMRTTMVRDGDTFVADLLVPTGSTLDYGFLVTKHRRMFDLISPRWDGNSEYHQVVVKPGAVLVSGRLAWLKAMPPLTSWAGYGATLAMTWAGLFTVSYLRISRPKQCLS